MGLPNVILVLAKNQQATAERLHTYGATINLGWSESVCETHMANGLEELCDSNRRQVMSEAGRRLVDGDGSERVIHSLEEVMP